MKSRIKTLADYREAPFEREAVIRCPEEHIRSQMRHLTRAHKRSESVQVLEKGDVAVLTLESALAKFNRQSVFVTVGGGLFDKDFEEQLIGHAVGESFQAEAQGQPVRVTVKQASRTVFPEPTDEMAAAYAAEHEEFRGAVTVAAYREKVVEQYLEEERRGVFFNAMDAVQEYVLTHSDFDFDEDEIAGFVAETKKEILQQLDLESLEQLSEDQLRGNFGVESPEELEKMIKNQAEWSVASDLWVLRIHQKDSFEEIEGYPWEFLNQFVQENLKITEER